MNCLKCGESITEKNQVIKKHGVMNICKICFNSMPKGSKPKKQDKLKEIRSDKRHTCLPYSRTQQFNTEYKRKKIGSFKKLTHHVMNNGYHPCSCKDKEFIVDRNDKYVYSAYCNKCNTEWLRSYVKRSLYDNIMKLGIKFKEL